MTLSKFHIGCKNNTYNGAGGHVVHEATEEGLAGEVSVVLLEERLLGLKSKKKKTKEKKRS